MMRLYTLPASYARYLRSAIDITKNEILRDVDLRSDEYAPLRRFAPVDDGFIEPEKQGSIVVVVLDGDNPVEVAALAEILAASSNPVLRSATHHVNAAFS